MGNFISNTCWLHCHHQNNSASRWASCVSHFNVSLTVWAKSQDSVHKPQFLKRKESRSGSNRGPSAYQPSALPLGHTGSRTSRACPLLFILSFCLFLSLWPFQLYTIPYILPTTLRFLTLFFRSYLRLIGPFNYISLYGNLLQP